VLYFYDLVYTQTMRGGYYMDQIKIGKFISSKRKEKNILKA